MIKMTYNYCVVVQTKNDIYNLFVPDLPIDVVSHESIITAERMIKQQLKTYLKNVLKSSQKYIYDPSKLKDIEPLLKNNESLTIVEVNI